MFANTNLRTNILFFTRIRIIVGSAKGLKPFSSSLLSSFRLVDVQGGELSHDQHLLDDVVRG
jgi:hypothetical protein